MSVLIFTNLLAGSTGLDKSVVMTANQLKRRGYAVSIVNFVGPGDGTRHLMPRWQLDPDVPAYALQTLPAEGGRWLHRNVIPEVRKRIPNLNYAFTSAQFAALRQLNAAMSEHDSILFTHPLQAQIFQRAIGDDERRCRTIMQIHGDYRARHPELRPMLLGAKTVIDDLQVVSKGLELDYVDQFDPERIWWVPNIHDPQPVSARTSSSTVRVALVGSFQEAKNQLDAVRMIQRLGRDDVVLTLWGNNDTPYGNYVKAFVDHAGLEQLVRLPGLGDERTIYEHADIVVIPSRSEGFGYALVEAAAHALPVVAYDYRYGPRDVIDDGRSGFIVPEGDIDAMADRVRRLADDPALRTSLGRHAHDVFQREFAPDRVVDRYDEMLGSCAAATLDVADVFAVDDATPVAEGSLRTRQIAVARRTVAHLVTFRANTKLRDFEVSSDGGTRRRRPARLGRRYALVVLTGEPRRSIRRAERRVVSFETPDPGLGRFYLGNTTRRREFEIGRHLLRSPWVGVPAAFDDVGDRDLDQHDCADAKMQIRNEEMLLPRHPRVPVTAGHDDLGEPINAPGAVTVENHSDVRYPAVVVRGEFDELTLADHRGTTTVRAPFGYAEMFDRVLAAERTADLFDYTVLDDIHAWELLRGAFIATTAEALGFWGPHFSTATVGTWDAYVGPKRLADAPRRDRVVFEFPRKADGPDRRTAALHSDDTMIIEYPQAFGYDAGVYTEPNRFPISEYFEWRKSHRVDLAGRVDARPIEQALSRAFELPVRIGDRLERRVTKFLEERDFWTTVFERVQPSEVVIPSSHWSAGICAAAHRVGALPADVQYALTSRYHPTFWFGSAPRHGARRLYAWSSFWADRTNAYDRSIVLGRPDLDLDGTASPDPEHDYCVVSQPRVSRRLLAFTERLARRHPDARICLAPHPDEREAFADRVARLAELGNVTVAAGSTVEAMRRAHVVIGAYSTSVYEAAAMGKPTYIVPVPGHEIVAADIETGLFRLAHDVDHLEPFAVPESRHRLFEG